MIFGFNSEHLQSNSSLRLKINDCFNEYCRKREFGILDVGGLRIFYKKNSTRILEGNRFLVLGTINTIDSVSKVTATDINKYSTVEEILDSFWGDYLIFSTKSRHLRIAKSHFSLSSFYYQERKDGTVFSTSLNTFSGMFNCSINEEYLLQYLVLGDHHSHLTPLEDVHELSSGTSYEQGKVKFLNIPKNEYLGKDSSDYDIENRLHFLMEKVIKSSVSRHKSIYHEFSGGLDSTAILMYLLKINKSPKLVNYFNASVASSDELLKATNIAKDYGLEIIPFDTMQALPFDEVKGTNIGSEKPCRKLLLSRQYEILSENIMTDESLLVSGVGGDEMFLSSPVASSLTDALLDGRFKGGFNRMFEFSCFYNNATIYRLCNIITKDLISYFFKKKASFMPSKFNLASWFSNQVLESIKTDIYLYKTILTYNNYLPGKLLHMRGLYDSLAGARSNIVRNNLFYPFLSQPLVSFAQSIDAYRMYKLKTNRVIMRSTLDRKFNLKSAWEQKKGQTTGVLQMGLKKNKNQVMERVREGYLVKNKMINFDGFRQSVENLCMGSFNDIWPIVDVYTLELFLKNNRNSRN